MNNKRKVKKLLKALKLKAKVEYGEEFYVKHGGKQLKIVIRHEKAKYTADDRMFNDLVEKIFNEKIDHKIVPALHEVAHVIKKHTPDTDAEEKHAIDFLSDLGAFTRLEAFEHYIKINSETEATKWALEFRKTPLYKQIFERS